MVKLRIKFKGMKMHEAHFRTVAEAKKLQKYIGREGKTELIARKYKRRRIQQPSMFGGGFGFQIPRYRY